MDHDDLKACKMSNDVRLLHSHEKQDRFGKVKSLSVCCGKLSDANSGYDKQRYESNHGIEISSCEAATLPEMRRKCPNYDNISTSDCNKGDANNLELVCSVVSTSRNSFVEVGLYEKENCAEGTSGAMSCCDGRASSSTCQNKLSDDGNLKDGGVSTQSLEGIHSTQHIFVKSDVSSQTGKSLNKEQYESDIMRTKENWLNAGQDGSKSMMQATSHGMQLKTESSSSNSTHVTLPASSNGSCQETSVDAKTCKHSRSSGMSSFICTGFKCSLEEPTVKSIVLDMAAEIASKAPLNTSASQPGKQGSLAKALGSVDNIRERDNEKVLGMIVDENSMIVEKIDFSRSSLLKKSNAECPNRDKAKLSYVWDDALEVAWRVAREVEQVVGIYGEASASSSSIEQRNDETIRLSSVDSADPNRKDFLIDSGHRITLCTEQDKCDSFCSTKEVVDPETSVKNDLCLQVKEPPKEGLALIHEADDSLQGQESSQLTTVVEGEAVNGQIPRLCKFDLNEDIQGNELEYPIQSVNENALSHHGVIVSTPIRVVAKSGVPTCLPMTPLKFEGEGWRGSAATSAFQPAPRSKSSNSINESSAKENDDSPKHSQDFKGIDLNVAASGDDFGMELSLKKCVPVPSDFPSKDSSVEISSKQAKRLNIDLNCLGENEENCPQLSLPGSSSRQIIGDFDLNDNPSFGDACNYTHQPGQATQSLRNRALDDHAVLMGNARHPDSNGARVTSCWADLSSMQGFGHGHGQSFPVAMTNVISPVEQMQRAVPPQPKLTLPPPPPPPRHAFLYNNGFCIDPTDSLPSTIYSPGVLPYVTDQRGMTFIPQILYSSTLPAFPGAPHLMEVAAGPSPADIAIVRPGFDLNGGLSSSETRNARQLFIPISNSLMQEQMKSFRQGLKRREPDGGWDHSQRLGYRQDTSWH